MTFRDQENGVKVYPLVVDHSDIHGFCFVTVLREGQSVGATLDGTMEVTDGVGGHLGIVDVMILNHDGHPFDGLVSVRIVHQTMDAVHALLDEGKHGGVVIVPISRHGGGTRLLGGRALNGDFTTFTIGIFVVLATACDDIPLSTVGDPV